MARLARAVVPGLPLHITQRGNRRQQTFFGTDDYLLYLSILAEQCDRCGVEIWSYCLMPNHVHLIAVPTAPDSLVRAISEAHRRYTREVNLVHEWRGHLWQGRFASFVMDEHYTLAAARYIERNPVRAGLAVRAEDYLWSSARAHLLGRDDALVKTAPLLALAGDWSAFLGITDGPEDTNLFRRHASTGRPLGSDVFVDGLEGLLGRILRPRKPGPVARSGKGCAKT
jgi:putative transposase